MAEMKTTEPTPWHRSFDVVEACRRDARINHRLREILGGVPVPKAPPPTAQVVELPVASAEPLEEVAA